MVFECFLQKASDHESTGLYLHLQKSFLRSGRLFCLHIMLQETITWWTSAKILLTDLIARQWQNSRLITWRKFFCYVSDAGVQFARLLMRASCETRPLETPVFIWNTALIEQWLGRGVYLNPALIWGNTVHFCTSILNGIQALFAWKVFFFKSKKALFHTCFQHAFTRQQWKH